MSKKSSGRPKCFRIVKEVPDIDYFKPRGIPMQDLKTVKLKLEELEAIRLVDLEELEQKDAAIEMKISRRTLARELKQGRKKIADALMKGKAIEIKGGYYTTQERIFMCRDCKNEWIEPPGTGKPEKCPTCGVKDMHRRGGEKWKKTLMN